MNRSLGKRFNAGKSKVFTTLFVGIVVVSLVFPPQVFGQIVSQEAQPKPNGTPTNESAFTVDTANDFPS
jgi:hypothetical protein